ncbi:hypothetical protein PF010_g25929 [Phytophthora fragariae]|nr:hypothetical protein PF003_g30306 [Phytophthora fragariae]KAE8922932.1 hypothetical protein PF009_g26808 [Phytophthora fragariae]KAE8975321.1 hypothetical protein PF011_g24523 [Phytophthora fragariae]KAE9071278.1 hypothetical protein PF010_g25929 [Phytophthora fragariae]KAE9071787.1 hypothetical protein PF007_g26421 [Phytophthora fragariae]
MVAVASLAASVGASSVVTESKMATARALIDEPSGIRLLRTEKLTDEDDVSEERAGFDFVNKLKNLIKPKSVSKVAPKVIAKEGNNLPADLAKMLKAEKSTDDAFAALNIKNAGTNLFRRDKLPGYVRYSELASKQTGTLDVYGIATLRKHFTDIELSKVVNAGMKSTDDLTKATAERLRAGQFGTWLRERKEPREVYQLLKGGTKTISDVDRANWRKYLGKFNKLPVVV